MKEPQRWIGVVGDVHGHLQLACCVMAQWQRERGVRLEAVFLCGDVGTFADESQLDRATKRYAMANPCELEFLHQWAVSPQAPWLDCIFASEDDGGLGLRCPVIMVHGNHEGLAYLEGIVPQTPPRGPVDPDDLPTVDTNGHIRLLPSGWRVRLPSGCIVGGVGGIEKGQRRSVLHPMGAVDDAAVRHLREHGPVDILVTHQGPSGVHGEKGSEQLQALLDAGTARVWFHGHSLAVREPTRGGPDDCCLVVPLDDIGFPSRGPRGHEPGGDGWALACVRPDGIRVEKQAPGFLQAFQKHQWVPTAGGQLISPTLAALGWPHSQRNGRGS